MQIQQVLTPADERAFMALPFRLYAQDTNWIAPVQKDIRALFDAQKNHLLRKGACARWIVRGEKNGEVIGRIAAFINHKYKNLGDEGRTGGFGFFESEDNQEVANLLFDTARAWLEKQGCAAMDGPINFGERNSFWGLLVEGFTPPLFAMNYNPPYYQKLFENYGLQVFYEQLCFGVENAKNWHEDKIMGIYEQLKKDPDFRTETLSKNKMMRQVRDFVEIYNDAWAGHGGGKTLDERVAKKMFSKMKPLIEEGLSWLLYYKNEPVAVMINVPDVNIYFKHFRGRFGIIEKLRFLFMRMYKKPTRIVGMVYGVKKKMQGKGVDTLMIMSLYHYILRSHYEPYEMQWIGDFNTKMVSVARRIAPTLTRKLATYRLYFDPNKPFQRHPFL